MSKQTDLINVTDAINVSGSNVGIGTSSPTSAIDVRGEAVFGSGTDGVKLTYSAGNSTGIIDTGFTSTGLEFRTGNSFSAKIESSGNVGIGVIDPDCRFEVQSSVAGLNSVHLSNTSSTGYGAKFVGGGNTSTRYIADFRDYSGASKLKLDGDGNLLVGMSSNGITTAGVGLVPNGISHMYTTSERALELGRGSNDGEILRFNRSGITVGSIGVRTGSYGYLYWGSGPTGLYSTNAFNSIVPCDPSNSGADRDNAIDLGAPSARFDDIYATNGSIQTSDANEKQDIASLTATEMLVAARISGLFKTFRWIDSVADKGDNARTHTGVIAQDVQAAFIAEGLDAGDYALFTSATWWETQTEVPAVDAVEAVDATYDDDGNELTAAVEAVEAADAYTRTDTYNTLDEAPDGATERTRMGIRYPELLAFVGAYNEQRFASIETRLAALEAV